MTMQDFFCCNRTNAYTLLPVPEHGTKIYYFLFPEKKIYDSVSQALSFFCLFVFGLSEKIIILASSSELTFQRHRCVHTHVTVEQCTFLLSKFRICKTYVS